MVEQTFVPRIEDTELKRSSRTGYWEVRWTIPADKTGTGRARTRTYSCRTKDFAIAEEIRREYLSAAGAAVRASGAPTVGELIDAYKTDYLDPGKKSASQWESLKAPKRLLGKLTPDDLDDGYALDTYTDTRLQEVSSGTVRRELGALVAVFGWARRSRRLPKGYVPPVIELTPNSQARTFYLNDADERKLHDTAVSVLRMVVRGGRHPLWRAALFTVLALNTAARASAIEGLEWSRIGDLSKAVPALVDFRDPDLPVTRKRRSVVPSSNRLLPVLREEWVRQGKPTHGPVLGTFGSTRKGFEGLKKLAFGEKSPLVGQLVRHDLRRTWATLNAMAGVSMEEIARVLADTLDTTEKHYAHFHPDHLVSAVNKRG